VRQLKRLFYYLLINVLVSACTTLVVIQLWAWRAPAQSNVGPIAAVLTQMAYAPGSSIPSNAGTPGVVIITQVVTAPPEAFTPYPTRGVVTYKVKEGDTLGGIAQYFGISLQELLDLNDITDADRVISGVELLIAPVPTPTGTSLPRPTDTPTTTTTPTLTPTLRYTLTPTGPTPTPQPEITAALGIGDLANEHVELRLLGGGELSLLGWLLQDEDGNTFIFPKLTLRAGGQISIFTKTGETSVSALYWNQSAAVWQSGEIVTLLDTQGNVRAKFKIP